MGQFILGDDYAGCCSVRTGEYPEWHIFPVRPSNPGKPFHDQLPLFRVPASPSAIDERRTGIIKHPIHHETPAPFVVPVPHDLLVRMASFSTGATECLLLLCCPRQIPKPLRPRELGKDILRWGQEVRIGSPIEH